MKILVVSDETSPGLWDYYSRDKTAGVELIISCGDLKKEYLEFLTTIVNVPLLYVRGNHDESYDRSADEPAYQKAPPENQKSWRRRSFCDPRAGERIGRSGRPSPQRFFLF